MKIKLIAAACLTLCSAASFAATAVTCDTTTAEKMVNTCAVDAQLYIAGSSALGGGLSAVVTADLFDTTTTPIIKIVDNGSSMGDLAGAPGALKAVSAWYGMSKAAVTGGISKRLFVVYNKQNGSAAGISQLLSTTKDTTIPEQDVVTVGLGSTGVKGAVGTCVTDTTKSTALVPVLNCTTHARTQADLGISDVHPSELFKLEGVKPAALTTLKTTPLALQGFGVAVNAKLFADLQAAQSLTGTARPSISRAAYASLISKEGSIKTAATLVPSTAVTDLILARRDDLSGTQASSNIYFANNACGVDTLKGKKIAGHLGGALAIADKTTVASGLTVGDYAVGGDVVSALNATANSSKYVIGVISLTTAESDKSAADNKWRFVSIDGAAPIEATGDTKQRNAVRKGNYGFAMTAFAATPLDAKIKDADKKALTAAVITGLKDSSLHDLTGIAYLDGGLPGDALKQSLVKRTNGNNCSPLIN